MFILRSNKVRLLTRSLHVESKISSLGITLPELAEPKGNYVPYVRTGNTIFLSGHLPQKADKTFVTGRVGDNVSLEEARAAARLIGVNLIASMKHATGGDLDKVKRVVKLVGFVCCTENFKEQPQVMNGCSDLMVEVFGPEKGRHARSAVGTNALPLGVAVEVEAVIEIEP
mmetsp:Transcript_4472/g.4487  ORF Transcript_4472/g.4487 Transcript_4472/m.4487 type:complete len:171 (-) Transcript_4472:288-800(-)